MQARNALAPWAWTVIMRLWFWFSFCVKPGFHYPNSRPEFTGRVDCPWTLVHFLTPVNSGRQLWCQKMHPSSRAVNSGSGNRALQYNCSCVLVLRPALLSCLLVCWSDAGTGASDCKLQVYMYLFNGRCQSCYVGSRQQDSEIVSIMNVRLFQRGTGIRVWSRNFTKSVLLMLAILTGTFGKPGLLQGRSSASCI